MRGPVNPVIEARRLRKTFDAMMALTLPLTHIADLSRAFANGRIDAPALPGTAYPATSAAAVFPPAIHRMRRRPIR